MQTGLENNIKIATWEYDFAKDGGAIGDISLRGSKLPVGAIVLAAYVDVETAPLSADAATIALKITGAEDVLAATAIASFSLGALLECVPDFATVAHAIRVASAAKGVTMTIADFALTAGKFNVSCQYVTPR
jgi:hypothetical protein